MLEVHDVVTRLERPERVERRAFDRRSYALHLTAQGKALLQRGFKFVGSTICYAFMQATGMVNDHLVSCFRHAEVA